MLPLGRRVQDKLEALIDKYMFQLGNMSVFGRLNYVDNLARCFETRVVINFIRGTVGQKWPLEKSQPRSDIPF